MTRSVTLADLFIAFFLPLRLWFDLLRRALPLTFTKANNLNVTPFTIPKGISESLVEAVRYVVFAVAKRVKPCNVEGSRLSFSARQEGECRDSFSTRRFAQNDRLYFPPSVALSFSSQSSMTSLKTSPKRFAQPLEFLAKGGEASKPLL